MGDSIPSEIAEAVVFITGWVPFISPNQQHQSTEASS